ncbi:MAG: glycosyltransferase [Candidatus Schekmanbacteria bacterium]|nr:glycosyltransferase [Candidatus Schekmanbacteria bacterium]
MGKPRVFLTGGDDINWAMDDDLDLAKRALADIIEFSDLTHCDIIHSMWWGPLLELPRALLTGKRIICQMSNRPFHYMKQPGFPFANNLIGKWIAQSQEAQRELLSVGIASELIPYAVDVDIFRQLAKDSPELSGLRKQWNIPEDCYLIGNFHRDTEGRDLKTFKVQKGPDIFVEIVRELIKRGHRIHVLLAGPRRYWIRRRLTELSVPFTFIGKSVENEDDINFNILPRQTLNQLYNLLDLYLICSRWEGGPRSVMEAAASRCKVLSTKVGLAEDILDPASIYSLPVEAANIIEKDIQTNHLESVIESQFNRLQKQNTIKNTRLLFKRFYESIEEIPVYTGQKDKQSVAHTPSPALGLLNKINQRLFSKRQTICLWHRFQKPPWGGGNQFMLALRDALKKRGIRVAENTINHRIDAYILNSVQFDIDKFKQAYDDKQRLKIIHRVDGPIFLYRDSNKDLDELCFELNARLAYATVLQSGWTYQRIVETGYKPVNPVIIHNTVDPDIFNSQGRIPFDIKRKIRLISTSWSDNIRKGYPVYQWIDEHLDWSRFEYTFVGRVPGDFKNIRLIPPQPSEKLANILKEHDIYITASQNEPCSNALLEALACGLPTLYLNGGSHQELVGFGGLGFTSTEEIFPRLDKLVENYAMFQNLIVVTGIEEVADKYLALME